MSAFFFLILLSLPIFAEDKLETIHVNGDKNPVNYSFGDNQVLTKEDIKQSGSPFFGELLKSISSLMTVQNGGPGGRQSYFLRGTEPRQLAFMVDQLKTNDPSNNDRHFDSAFTLSEDIEKVVVLKSPQPVLYGSDAIGGVVLLKTRKGPGAGERASSLVSVGAGSFSSFQQTIQDDWKKENSQGTMTLSHYQTMGMSRLNKKRTNSTERDGAEVINLGSSSIHKYNKFESDLLLKYIHGMSEQDGYDSLGNNTDTSDRSYNDQYLFQHKTRTKTTIGSVQLRQGLNRHQRNIKTVSSGKEVFSGNNFINELTLVNRFDQYESTSGISYEHETFADQKTDKSIDLTSAFYHGKYQFQDLSFNGGLRGDHHSRFGNLISGSSGLNLNLGSVDLFAQYALGVKAPSLYQLFAPPSYGAPLGNKNLKAEKNKTTELGLKINTVTQNFVITVFQNDLTSQFTYINGQGYKNQDHFIAQGIEGNLTSYIGPKIRFQNSFTHQKFMSKNKPLRRPNNTFVSSLFWTPFESIELFIKERMVASRMDVNEFGKRVKLNPYEVTSLGGRWFKGNAELSLTVENIFDREYEDIFATTVMPLSFWTNFRYRF